MTAEVKKSIRSAAGVLVCIGAIWGGAIWRDNVDLGPARQLDISNLVASKSDHLELPESKFFEDVKYLLKKKYVDPVTDETKLADGAVRGMVASLGDPNSLYMDAEQTRVYNNVRLGKYEGIGADLVLVRETAKAHSSDTGDSEDTPSGLPKLVVASVVPGGAAEKAGLQPGDWAEYVDDHWIPNNDAFEKLLALSDRVLKLKDACATNSNRIPEYKKAADEYLAARKRLLDEEEKSVFPIKARDRLMIGSSGTVKTRWVRGGRRIELSLTKSETQMPGFAMLPDGAIRLPLVPGSAERLRDALRGLTEATIDLRNNVEGDFDAMMDCLKVVAPNGTYGYFVTRRNEQPAPMNLVDGTHQHFNLTLIVDRTTRGAAEIFAQALSTRGIAKLQGTETAGNPFVVRWNSLADGGSYTLVTSEYKPNAPTGAIARRDPATPAPAGTQPVAPAPAQATTPDSINPGRDQKRGMR